jgi:hypothetical protein
MIGSAIMNGVHLPDMAWFDDGKSENEMWGERCVLLQASAA